MTRLWPRYSKRHQEKFTVSEISTDFLNEDFSDLNNSEALCLLFKIIIIIKATKYYHLKERRTSSLRQTQQFQSQGHSKVQRPSPERVTSRNTLLRKETCSLRPFHFTHTAQSPAPAFPHPEANTPVCHRERERCSRQTKGQQKALATSTRSQTPTAPGKARSRQKSPAEELN